MSEANETQTRVTYLRRILYQILVILLKFSTTSHADCINKTNPNIGLAEVINKNLSKFKKKKCFHIKHHDEYFYDTATGNLKSEIKIDGMDLAVIYNLLKTSYLSIINNKSKCCTTCQHLCTVCTGVCEEKADCNFAECSNCKRFECLFTIFDRFNGMVFALRNVHAHSENEFFVRFEAGEVVFNDFKRSKTWEDLWAIVNEKALKCLEVLESKGFFSKDEYDDLKMELRIPRKKGKNFLLAVTGQPKQKERNRTNLSFCCLFGVVGVFFWQLYATESMYKFWQCKQGFMNPFQTANFTMNPLADVYANVFVEGIRFSFEGATQKTYHPNYKRLDKQYGEARYYVNINRCVYGSVKEYITFYGKRIQRGPDMFAVDGDCKKTFYYSDREDKWKIYISAKDVRCS